MKLKPRTLAVAAAAVIVIIAGVVIAATQFGSVDKEQVGQAIYDIQSLEELQRRRAFVVEEMEGWREAGMLTEDAEKDYQEQLAKIDAAIERKTGSTPPDQGS